MQPSKQGGVARQLMGTCRQRYESTLGDVLRQMAIPNHPQGCRIDEVDAAANQFGKGSLGMAFDVLPEERLVVQFNHFNEGTRPG